MAVHADIEETSWDGQTGATHVARGAKFLFFGTSSVKVISGTHPTHGGEPSCVADVAHPAQGVTVVLLEMKFVNVLMVSN